MNEARLQRLKEGNQRKKKGKLDYLKRKIPKEEEKKKGKRI